MHFLLYNVLLISCSILNIAVLEATHAKLHPQRALSEHLMAALL